MIETRRGDLLFAANNSFIGREIRNFTNCPYNHIGIFSDSGYIVEAKFSGVEETALSEFVKSRDAGKLEFNIFEFTEEISEEQIEVMVRFCEMEIGTSYDWLQFLSLAFMFLFKITRRIEPFDERHAWLCSELIGEAAYTADIEFIEDVDPDNITPADIINSGLVRRKDNV